MKKCLKNKHNFTQYAKYFNSQEFSHKTYKTRHKMIVRKSCDECRWFYNEYPAFCVAECNILTETLNNDYDMYVKWMVDD